MRSQLITIKLMGNLKKTFSNDLFTFERKNSTLQQVIDYLIKYQSENNNFDGKNVMIAVNGRDSSALDGLETTVKSGDIVTIIPIIHGGKSTRMQFRVAQKIIEVFEISKSMKYDKNHLQKIRQKFPKLTIQSISSNYILNKSHVKKIIKLSLSAKKKNNLLAKKLETDILLRFAGTTQISQAISNLGSKKNHNFVIIAIGRKSDLDLLLDEISNKLTKKPLKNNSVFLNKYFRINQKQLESVDSLTPLEDLIVEKSSILV